MLSLVHLVGSNLGSLAVLSKLSGLRKRGGRDNKPQRRDLPGRETTSALPLRARNPCGFAARFHQTEKPNRQAT